MAAKILADLDIWRQLGSLAERSEHYTLWVIFVNVFLVAHSCNWFQCVAANGALSLLY